MVELAVLPLAVVSVVVLPVVCAVPIELVAALAASHVPFTWTLCPTCALRSCVVSSCTPFACLPSITTNVDPCCWRQPLRTAFLPACSFALLDMLEVFEVLEVLEVVEVSVWLLAPVWSGAVLVPDGVLEPDVEPVPPACAYIAKLNARMTVNVSKIRFTRILLGEFRNPRAP